MKSHNYVSLTNPKSLAAKINRSGLQMLSPEEREIIASDVRSVAQCCTESRARELFESFGESIPDGFVANPVPGEKDAYLERLKREHDNLFKS